MWYKVSLVDITRYCYAGHHRSDEYAHAWHPISPRRKLAHSRSTKDNRSHGSGKSKSKKSSGQKVEFYTLVINSLVLHSITRCMSNSHIFKILILFVFDIVMF